MDMDRLAGKVALVTGAARGTGAEIARLFVAEGARGVLTDVLDERGAETAASLGSAARYAHLDVTSEDEWAAMASDVVAAEGALDVLVNNAAVLHLATIDATSRGSTSAQIPVGERKSGIPLSVETPAPVRTTHGWRSCRSAANAAADTRRF